MKFSQAKNFDGDLVFGLILPVAFIFLLFFGILAAAFGGTDTEESNIVQVEHQIKTADYRDSPIQVYHLNDGTRCVIIDYDAVDCEWK